MRAVVIGGGIVGAHVAAELAGRGAAVTLVDRGEPGGSTSERSFAWINCSNPDVDYLELRALGVEAWGRSAAALGRPPWLSLPGALSWSASPATQRRIDAHADLLAALGRRSGRLTLAETRRREPDLVVPRGVEGVHHFAGEGWVITRDAIAALLARAAAAGADVRIRTEVRRLIADGGGHRVTGVELANGERLDADAVVSCVGRFTEALLRPVGAHVPMIAPAHAGSPAVGLVVLTTPVRTGLRSVIHADGLSLRPDRDGRLAVHSAAHDEHVPVEGAAPAALAGELIALLRRHVRHTDDARAWEARVCFRPLPADGLPVAGRALGGLYVIATHSGVTLAPALAQLAASEIVDGADEALLAPFRPRRFARRNGE